MYTTIENLSVNSSDSLAQVSNRVSSSTFSKIKLSKPDEITLRRGSRLMYRLFGSWTNASLKNIPFTISISKKDNDHFEVVVAFDPGFYLFKVEVFPNKNMLALNDIVAQIKSEFPVN